MHFDIDVIMQWPLSKLYGYMSYYLTQTDEFKEKMRIESKRPMTSDEIANKLGGWDE
jgi:hypothetical protein